MELSNTSVAIATVKIEDSEGKSLQGLAYITHAWRYLFGTFAKKTEAIDVNWEQTVSNPPTQAEVQAIADQVSLLSQALGKT